MFQQTLDNLAFLMQGVTPDGVDCHTAPDAFGQGNAMEVETAYLLYSWVIRARPKTILQTGTHWGWSSVFLAMGLRDSVKDYPPKEDRDVPRLYTYDVDHHGHRARTVLEHLNLLNHVRLIQGDSRISIDPLPREMVEQNREIDFLALDGDHGTGTVLKEWTRFGPFLNKHDAYVLIHDTRLDPRGTEALNCIKREGLYPYLDYRHRGHIAFRNMRGVDFLHLSNTIETA